MPKEIIVLAYLALCTIVGLLGRHKTIGFWGFFFFSFVLTPVISLIILIIARDKGTSLTGRRYQSESVRCPRA